MRTTVNRYRISGKQACLRFLWLSENVIVMAENASRASAGRRPMPLIRPRLDPAHGGGGSQKYYLFRLSAPGGRTHNRFNNEDGWQCRRSLAAWVEG
jgi:hypothetical protein